MARYRALVTRTRTITEHAIVYPTSSADGEVQFDAFRLAQLATWTPDNDTSTPFNLANYEKVG